MGISYLVGVHDAVKEDEIGGRGSQEGDECGQTGADVHGMFSKDVEGRYSGCAKYVEEVNRAEGRERKDGQGETCMAIMDDELGIDVLSGHFVDAAAVRC